MQEGLGQSGGGGQPGWPRSAQREREQEPRAHTCLPKWGWGIPKLWQVGARAASREKMAKRELLV